MYRHKILYSIYRTTSSFVEGEGNTDPVGLVNAIETHVNKYLDNIPLWEKKEILWENILRYYVLRFTFRGERGGGLP